MKYPQTRAKTIGAFGCLAMCYLYCAGLDGQDWEYMKRVSDAMEEGLLDGDCTVLDAEKFLEAFTGKKWRVEKKVCVDISKIKKATPVRYDYNGANHWVVIQEGKIVFNSLINSQCVMKGKPSTMRVISKR